jgi:hypothetical protein
MKIDIFNHIFPQTFFDKYIENGLPDIGKRVKNMPSIVNLDALQDHGRVRRLLPGDPAACADD